MEIREMKMNLKELMENKKQKRADLLWELESLISMRGFHVTVKNLVAFTNKCNPKEEVA